MTEPEAVGNQPDASSGFAASVADIQLERQAGLVAVWRLSLDQTGFAPGDRGWLEAVTRSGTRLRIAVTAVFADEAAVIWHTVEKPLAAGTEVRGHVLGPASPASDKA